MGVWKQLQLEKMDLENKINNLEELLAFAEQEDEPTSVLKGLNNKLVIAISELDDFSDKHPEI